MRRRDMESIIVTKERRTELTVFATGGTPGAAENETGGEGRTGEKTYPPPPSKVPPGENNEMWKPVSPHPHKSMSLKCPSNQMSMGGSQVKGSPFFPIGG